jgi:hypothetical protein
LASIHKDQFGIQLPNEIGSKFVPLNTLAKKIWRLVTTPTETTVFRPMPEFPVSFDSNIYRELNEDLSSVSENDLQTHFDECGINLGLRSHSIVNRTAFVQIVPRRPALEIGPFAAPLLKRPNVKYVDVFSTSELKEMAPKLGLDPESVPNISWVADPTDLSIVNEKFQICLSSHVIEHQPNLITHLNQVSNLLEDNGRYFLLVPDHRYCFDHFMTPSTISQVIGAFIENRVSHTPQSFMESRLHMTHNDPTRHWNNDHGFPEVNPYFPTENRIERLRSAIDEARQNSIPIRDEHAWYFTPSTFQSILTDLKDLKLIDLEIERMYPTLKNSNEFWVILRKPLKA